MHATQQKWTGGSLSSYSVLPYLLSAEETIYPKFLRLE